MEMLRAGADINATTREGRTALQMSRYAAQQEGWFSRLFWSLIDPQAREVARCRQRFERTLRAAGAK
jgi:hypothetical protein